MMNNKHYEAPYVEVLEIEIEQALLQGSEGINLSAEDHNEFDIWQ